MTCLWHWASASRRRTSLTALPEDARPDAAVLGSALLRHIAEGKDAAEFLGKWTGK